MDNLHCAFAVPKPDLGERESSGLAVLLYDGCVTRILRAEQPNGMDELMKMNPKLQDAKYLVFGLDAAAVLSEIVGLTLMTVHVDIFQICEEKK